MTEPRSLVRDVLTQAKEGYRRQLIELAMEGRKPSEAQKYGSRAEQLLREIDDAERALASITPGPSIKYCRFKTAIEAIQFYLSEVNRPASEEEIVRALCEGGFRGGVEGTDQNIRKSFRSYESGKGTATGYIKKVGDLFGLKDWEQERFQAR